MRWALTAALAAACLAPFMRPEYALILGVAVALLGLAPHGDMVKKLSRITIQVCVVGLGFAMNLHELVRAGLTGLWFGFGTIVATFALGFLLAKWLRIDQKLCTLISSGTAICGGSAIAAVGSTIRASGTHMSVAIGVVFILNAIGLWVFPPLGHSLNLSQHQFGVWSAVAIHDVSSVVGAASAYGKEALEVATAVKLSRTLWIVPVAVVAAWFFRKELEGKESHSRLPVPWFILLFVLASVAGTYFVDRDVAAGVSAAARRGMNIALFLVGLGLSRRALASVGVRPLVLAVALWMFISIAALVVVRTTIQ
ncbi:MAG: putative sulfate exporter family transporter [Phycisphaeraceae bacterium]|nr:putative sulfate exporter family transporter [Phycisphaeraceae bacterium]